MQSASRLLTRSPWSGPQPLDFSAEFWQKANQRKEQFMSNSKESNRVLGRISARELTEKEINAVAGGLNTGLCTLNPLTCAQDGDCTPEPNC